MKRSHIKTYWKRLSAEEKRSFADRAETTYDTLKLIANGHCNASLRFGKRIVAASNGLVDINSVLREPLP